jgi:hypothetical protein
MNLILSIVKIIAIHSRIRFQTCETSATGVIDFITKEFVILRILAISLSYGWIIGI